MGGTKNNDLRLYAYILPQTKFGLYEISDFLTFFNYTRKGEHIYSTFRLTDIIPVEIMRIISAFFRNPHKKGGV